MVDSLEAPEGPHPRLRDRSVRSLLLSVFCGSSANLLLVTALGKFVFDLSHREIDLGLLGLVEFAPALLLVVITGAVADRFDRRRVAALALGFQAIVATIIAFLVTQDDVTVGMLLFVVVFYGSSRAFVSPVERALPADCVDARYVPWFMVRYSTTWQITSIAGPVIAGFSYVVDPVLPFVIAACLYIVAALSVLFVQTRGPVMTVPQAALRSESAHDEGGENMRGGGIRAAFAGFRFVRHQPILLGAISLDLFAVLFGGAVALLPAIAEEQLHVGAIGLGCLRAAVGVGAGVTTLVLTRKPIETRVGRTLFIAVAGFGALTVLLGFTHNYFVALITIALLSGCDAISVFIRMTLVPLVTPAHMRGRVLALENVFIGASNELGAFESGVVGQLLGASGAIILGGSATLVVAALWAIMFPALRTINKFPSHSTEKLDVM